MILSDAVADRLVRRLESIDDLSPDERRAVMDLPTEVRSFSADQDIVAEGERPTRCCLVVEGFLFRYKLVADGKRQILSFHIPGDIPDLHSLHLGHMDHSLAGLTDCTVALIPHRAIDELVASRPRLALTLWRKTLIDAAVSRTWMISLGRRSAFARIAHLYCEMLTRLESVGLGTRAQARLPITQAVLADALGLSLIHVNRMLAEIKRRGLVIREGAMVNVPDWNALAQAADFDPTYLHLRRRGD